jgi:hypothetical protein
MTLYCFKLASAETGSGIISGSFNAGLRKINLTGLILALCSLIISGFELDAQKITLDKKTGRYTYFGVGLVGTQTRDSTYLKTLEWVKFNYKSPKEVIQEADRNNYKIVLAGNFKTNVTKKEAYIGYVITLICREGRLNYTFTDFNYFTLGSGRINFEEEKLPAKRKMLKDAQKKVEKLIGSLTSYILLNEIITE